MERWWAEARKNDVLPLDNRVMEAIAHPNPTPGAPATPSGISRAAPPYRRRSQSSSATAAPHFGDMDVDDAVVPSGVLLALGCALGGWSFHVLDGRLRYVHNLYGGSAHVLHAEG